MLDAMAFMQLPAQDTELVLGSSPLDDSIDTIAQLKKIQRLQNVVVGAEFHGVHGGLHRPMTCYDEKAGLRIHLAHRFEQIEPVNPGHLQIADDQVNILECFYMLKSYLAILKRDDFVSDLSQCPR